MQLLPPQLPQLFELPLLLDDPPQPPHPLLDPPLDGLPPLEELLEELALVPPELLLALVPELPELLLALLLALPLVPELLGVPEVPELLLPVPGFCPVPVLP